MTAQAEGLGDQAMIPLKALKGRACFRRALTELRTLLAA
jgi:hypothetical protein